MSLPKTIPLLASVAAGALFMAAAARPAGAEATPAQAASMESQIRDTLGGLLGPSIKIGNRPIQVTPEGDHYDLLVDVALDKIVRGSSTFAAPETTTPLQVTGTAKPGENGIWIVEGIKTNSPLHFTILMPVPPTEGDAGPAKSTPVSYTVEQKGQDGRIVWDPSFQTPSTWTTTTQSSSIHAEGGPIPHDTTIGATNAVTTLRPAGDGRMDVLVNGALQDYDIDGSQSASPLRVAMQRLRVDSAMNSVNRADAVRFIQAITSLIAAKPPADSPALPPLVKAVLATMQDLASSFMLDETIEGMTFQAQGQNVALARARLEMDVRSDQGLMKAGMTLGLEGLGLPNLPLGPMEVLLPRHVELRPVIGGVTAADLLHMANLATDNIDPTPADIAALFSHGGVTGGLDSMTVEVGGATFTGQGSLVATAPSAQAVTGTAQVTATNYDDLMQKVSAIPGMGQQALPVMVFIKGIGRTVDNKLVWDATYKDGKVLINNVDLTAMAAGAGPAPAARPVAPAPRPSPGGSLKQPTRPATPGQVPSWGK